MKLSDALAGQRAEGVIDVAFIAGIHDLDLPPERARGELSVADVRWRIRIGRVHEQADGCGVGRELGDQLHPLGHQIANQHADASQIAAWAVEAADEARLDRIAGDDEDNRYGRGCGLGGRRRNVAGRDQHCDPPGDEIGRQRRQPVISVLRPAVFDGNVLPLDEATFVEA